MGSHLSDANAKRDRETSPLMRKAGGRRDRPQSTTFRSSKRSRHRADAVIETQSRRWRRGDEWLAYCRGSASTPHDRRGFTNAEVTRRPSPLALVVRCRVAGGCPGPLIDAATPVTAASTAKYSLPVFTTASPPVETGSVPSWPPTAPTSAPPAASRGPAAPSSTSMSDAVVAPLAPSPGAFPPKSQPPKFLPPPITPNARSGTLCSHPDSDDVRAISMPSTTRSRPRVGGERDRPRSTGR